MVIKIISHLSDVEWSLTFNLVDGHRGHTRSRVTCLSSLMSVKQRFDKILGNVCSQQDLKTIRG